MPSYRNYCPITDFSGRYTADVPKEPVSDILSRGDIPMALHQCTYLAHQGLKAGVISVDEALGDSSAVHALVHILDGIHPLTHKDELYTDEILCLAQALEDVVYPVLS